MAQMLRKTSKFSWNETCEGIFGQLKEFLPSPSVIQKPRPNLPIVVYPAVSEEAVNSALVQDINNKECPVYFVSRMLHVAETRVLDDRKGGDGVGYDRQGDATILPESPHHGKDQLSHI